MIENLEKGQIWGTPDYPGFRYRINEIMSDSSISVTITHNYEVIRCEMIDGVEVNHFTEVISVSKWLELMARGVLVKRPAPRIKLNPVGWRLRDWARNEETPSPSYNSPGISIVADVTISPQEIYGCSPVSPSGSGADPGSSTGSWSAVNAFTSSTNKITAAEIIEMSRRLKELSTPFTQAKQAVDDFAEFRIQTLLNLIDVPMITQPPRHTGELFTIDSLNELPVLNPRPVIKGTSE